LFDALVAMLGTARASRERTERLIYARDLWPLHTMRAREGILPPSPGIVVWPETEDEVVAIVNLARAHRVPITPYGGGSGVLGGAMPSPGGIVMDLKRMDRVVSIDPLSSTCVVEPGILGQHLEDRLNERGYTLGHFPSSLMTATVGGYVATRSAGQFSSRYGKIEDMVVSMRFVTGTGAVLDTAQESLATGGPDVNQILLGSEGTLGIVTRTTLKVYPAPASAVYRGIRFPSLEAGLTAMRLIMQAGLRPSVMRLYDEIDTFLVGRGDAPLTHGDPAQTERPEERSPDRSPGVGTERASGNGTERASGDGTERASGGGTGEDHRASSGRSPGGGAGKGLKAAARRLPKSLIDRFPQVARGAVRMALGRPALIERLSERFLPHELLLILGFEGEPEEVAASMPAGMELCFRAGGVDLGPGPGLRWLAKRYDVSFKMPSYFHLGAFVDTIEVASTWDRIPRLYHDVRAVAGREVMVMAHFSHAYPEGVSIYFSIGGSAEGLEATVRKYERTWQSVMEVVLARGATVSHHHGVGLMKAPYVTREQGAFLSLYRPLKARIDPEGILNPGKLYVLEAGRGEGVSDHDGSVLEHGGSASGHGGSASEHGGSASGHGGSVLEHGGRASDDP
jgi:alkyldihydroxyacetonephosphate synthase